jgi:hypothetical protein
VIDPSTRAVTRTITLRARLAAVRHRDVAGRERRVRRARGGRPALKFDTTTYAQTGSAAIGPNARHLSISGDGARLYVSRFVTPPLPGESTATVTPTASTGGEVLQLDAASLAVSRTIVLQHSDKPDGETQGRGIPNYLGAAVISPRRHAGLGAVEARPNIKRGGLRDSTGLNFQNTVRAVSSASISRATARTWRHASTTTTRAWQAPRSTSRVACTCSSRWRRAAKWR